MIHLILYGIAKVSQYNNKSFFFSGNKFYMYPWGNYCIKAFTTESEGEEQEKIEGLQEKDGGLYYFKDGVVGTNYTGTANTRVQFIIA